MMGFKGHLCKGPLAQSPNLSRARLSFLFVFSRGLTTTIMLMDTCLILEPLSVTAVGRLCNLGSLLGSLYMNNDHFKSVNPRPHYIDDKCVYI